MMTPTAAERELSSDEIRAWLRRHRACVGAGMNVGLVQRSKARRLEAVLMARVCR